MKVMCTSENEFSDQVHGWEYANEIKIGDICEVEHERIGSDGIPCYKLVGFSRYLYDKRNFSPLSEIDETELINQREPQSVN